MNYSLLIEAQELQTLLVTKPQSFLLFDCRFDLADPLKGQQEFASTHIPRAIYVSLTQDLSGKKDPSKGRHPLPTPTEWLSTKQRLGISLNSRIVIYDDSENIYSARMWWMLKSTGHTNIQLLNGGIQAWKKTVLPLSAEATLPNASQIDATMVVTSFSQLKTMLDVQKNLEDRRFMIVDARASNRFRGENETLDPVAGHIPNALNRPYKNNLTSEGLFKSPEVLHQEWASLTQTPIVHQCGSGVTACNNLFAMELAGLKGSSLYAGSWSEWCYHPQNPVATGNS